MAAVCLVFGALFVLMAAIEFDDRRILTSRGLEAAGKVVAKTGGRSRYIKVSYETREGNAVTAETEYFKEPVSVGDTITIRYDPDDPELIQHTRWDFSIGVIAFLAAMGAAFVAIGIYSLWRGPPSWLV